MGRWGLTFGYFIPGVRHFTAYAAGMSELDGTSSPRSHIPARFCGRARLSSLGYFLGERWESTSEEIHKYLLIATGVGLVLVLLYLGWRKWRGQKAA